MPQAPLRQCRKIGCSELTRTGWCSKHQDIGRRQPEWHKWYNRNVWKKVIRQDQLLREPFCRACASAGKRERATVVDHITPFRGVWSMFVDENNLQSLCKQCHDRKTMEEFIEERH